MLLCLLNSAELLKKKHTPHVKDLARDVAEDVFGTAKDGSDLAQDVTEDVLGAAKNGRMKV